MPARNRAAYMRGYRAKRTARLEASADELANNVDWPTAHALVKTIADLRDEVARLKRELAQRPERDPFSEFRPIPKPGRK